MMAYLEGSWVSRWVRNVNKQLAVFVEPTQSRSTLVAADIRSDVAAYNEP